jgi:peptidoglycan biosynthesis protein MviN/MurJ (putative lipid II flippase)
MVWVIFAAIAIVFAALVLWAATRRGAIPLVVEARRPDLARSGLSLLAAAVASVAAVVAYADQTNESPPIVGILGIAVAAALALAVIPPGGSWSDNRRLAAAVVACIWLAVGFGVWPFAMARSACACGGAGPFYVPPAPLGIDARGWITIAILGGPVCLALAASRLPDRFRRATA